MIKLGLVTCRAYPDLTEDDQLLIPAFKEKRIIAKPVIWNDGPLPPNEYDLLIVRSPWDYFLTTAEYISWMNKATTAGYKILNKPEIIKKNLHKSYIKELQRRGILTADTMFIPKGSILRLEEVFERKRFKRVVIKPAISGGAFETYLVNREEAVDYNPIAAKILEFADLMIQDYIEEIETGGEYSLIFLNGEYSHAVLKKVAPGDFRTQIDFGGTVEAIKPSASLIDQAYEINDALGFDTLYSRVDGIYSKDEFKVIELEMFEPNLYFSYHEKSVQRFVESVIERIG
jgi:glutathione synthase/RimK-type ligase-like ATP-grasp enzyme